MGYMGLSHWMDSDNASELHHNLVQAIEKTLRADLKRSYNAYNTPGWVNALLIFKSYPQLIGLVTNGVLDAIDNHISRDLIYLKNEEGFALIKNFRDTREEFIKKWKK